MHSLLLSLSVSLSLCLSVYLFGMAQWCWQATAFWRHCNDDIPNDNDAGVNADDDANDDVLSWLRATLHYRQKSFWRSKAHLLNLKAQSKGNQQASKRETKKTISMA